MLQPLTLSKLREVYPTGWLTPANWRAKAADCALAAADAALGDPVVAEALLEVATLWMRGALQLEALGADG